MTDDQTILLTELVELNTKIQNADDKQDVISYLNTAIRLASIVEPHPFPNEAAAAVRKGMCLRIVQNEALYIDGDNYKDIATVRYSAALTLLMLINIFTADPIPMHGRF